MKHHLFDFHSDIMTLSPEGIIRLAREAGFQTGTQDYAAGNGSTPFVRSIGDTCLVEVENLVKASYAAGAADEREACAHRAGIALLGADRGLAKRVDQAIRSRGQV